MSDDDVFAPFGGRFVLRHEYAGGEGRTLRVRADDGRDLVLKVLPAGAEPVEASLLLSLRHPAIPAVREVGRLPDGRAFVVRDHVEGTPMRVLPRDPAALSAVLQQLLEVLAYVHLRGVLHLDLKPANLVLDASGSVHLLDFGLGVRGGAAGRGGTPFFAAPELLLGGVPDARADLFSVGAMVAQALWPGGGPPFAGFVAAFPGADFFVASGLARDALPAPFGRFVAGCVSRRPARRFPDAQSALEALCGGSGRPAPSLLAPDPVTVFANELRAAAAVESRDVVLCGADPSDRRSLAMHLVATLRGVQRLVESRDELRLVRSAAAESLRIVLPPLDAERLLSHLHGALGLDGPSADAAAQWLVARGASVAAVHATLLGLLKSGELVPSGMRWAWPAARSGRLEGAHETAPADEGTASSSPARIRAIAAAGHCERAIALWQRAAAVDPAREEPCREALVEGLLDGGEPLRALPFSTGLPVLRAQALFETGRTAAARREMATAGERPATPRHRRVAAQMAMAAGDRATAATLLRQPDASVLEQLTLAAVHEQAGELEESERLLREWTPRLSVAEQPFACASAHTVHGHVLRRRGDLVGARAQFERASELLFSIGHVRHAASARLNLGVIAKDLQEHALAVECLREARTMYTHVGDGVGAAIAAANLGIAALARGDAAAARPWLEDAAHTLLESGSVAAGRLAQAMLARAHAELGDVAGAEGTVRAIGEPASDRVRAEVDAVNALLAARRAGADASPCVPDSTMQGQGPSRELFRTFLAVNRQLAQENDLDKAMRHLLDAAVTLTGGRIGYLLVARDDGMRREFQSGDSGPSGQAFSRSLANRAMQVQRTLTGADGLADRDLQDAPSIKNLQIRSAICSPFRSAGGTLGAIYVEHPGRAGVFADADKEALEVLADQAAIAVDRMLREEAMAKELTASRRELAVVKRASRRESTQLLGDSRPMRDLRAQIDKLAPLELPVLVLGETGSGKELVARALHERSHRHRGPFVAENCSVLPPELMERELFGHVQGAFTGADRDRPGLLELANGGTLFLDEVGDMPAALQVKLLRALQEQSIRRVGGTENVALDLRLVAATHKDLRAMVQRGEFREDLFFRLAAVEVKVPPLRERGGDIVQLAEHFVRRHGEERGRALRLHAAAKQALLAYPWPGNVRELDHVIARAALLCESEEVVGLDLPQAPVGGAAAVVPPSSPAEVVTLKEAERRAIVAAMQACGGDKAKTARALEISRTALYEKLKRHGAG
ncbi:MAG: sigma 54-interacting transcriptional regulator [Planctomycetes bacterium]|nr:sigma 54-interacting transcriptional regulator [Planctomycetota bacterium]